MKEDTEPDHLPTLDDINGAKARIERYIRKTPLIHSELLSEIARTNIYLKLENLQNTGSYKVRGAANKIELLRERGERQPRIITASAGNHAQGVAYAARTCGIAQFTEIVMATDSKKVKQDKTKRYGVTLTLFGKGYDEASKYARERAVNVGRTMIEAFNDDEVIAGQGTVGLEILEDLPNVTAVVCPVGGGGLISGIGIVGANSRRKFGVYGVQAKAYSSMIHAVKVGYPDEIANFRGTLADGIAVRKTGEKTLRLVQRYVGLDRLATVEEGETVAAMARLAHYEHVISEGAGAVGVAAISKRHFPFQPSDHVVVVISGGNISWDDFRKAVKSFAP